YGLQNSLGLMYSEGKEVSQNYVLASMWFILVSDNGHPTFKSNLEYLKLKMTPAQIENAETLAEKWRDKFIKH
ncbi:MAG: SEL1-like repeat protein, partial [Desulfobacterales bacterium]|nr:SEL1-like repeat protein [Desulfobacterales bacterium]